jgi:hypothetical protein
MVLGAVRAWLLAAAILPATWRGWDPHLPAVPGSHVAPGRVALRWTGLIKWQNGRYAFAV